MKQVKNGDSVRVHYTGKLEDGTEFDSSRERDPIEFTVGSGNLIPGFEKSVVGMKIGDKKTITVQPEDAYGEKNQELVVEIDKNDFPSDITPEVGMPLQIKQSDDNVINVMITEITEVSVTIDANHPLAGKALVFDIELVEFL